MHYQKGNYDKSCRLLLKAERWAPDVLGESIFEGILGLSLYPVGREQEGLPYMLSARDNLRKVASHNPDVHSLECYVLDEINRGVASMPAQ